MSRAKLSPIDETLEDRFLPVHRGSLRGTLDSVDGRKRILRVSARNTLLLKSEGRGGPPGRPRVVSRRPSSTLAVRGGGGKAFALDKRVSRACQEQKLSHRRNSGGSFSSGTQEGPSEGPLDSCGRKKTHPQSFGSNTLLLKSEGRGGPQGDHEWSPAHLWPVRGGWQ